MPAITMKATEDGGLLSDTGHTFLMKFKGEVQAVQHSIAEGSLSQEDKDMYNKPEEMWEEFFRQSTPDDV